MNDEELLDTITRQRLAIYHQERRIEALEKSLSQATQMNPNDLVNQAFTQLQTSNELMAAKLRIEKLEKHNSLLQARGGNLCQMLGDIADISKPDAIAAACIRSQIQKWKEAVNV
jgi:hypothetical protein